MMGVRVVARPSEPISQVIRRFKKQVQLNGVMWEVRKRSCFVDGTQLRRAKRLRKRFKAREATLIAKMAGEQSGGSVAEEKAEFRRRTGKP